MYLHHPKRFVLSYPFFLHRYIPNILQSLLCYVFEWVCLMRLIFIIIQYYNKNQTHQARQPSRPALRGQVLHHFLVRQFSLIFWEASGIFQRLSSYFRNCQSEERWVMADFFSPLFSKILAVAFCDTCAFKGFGLQRLYDVATDHFMDSFVLGGTELIE